MLYIDTFWVTDTLKALVPTSLMNGPSLPNDTTNRWTQTLVEFLYWRYKLVLTVVKFNIFTWIITLKIFKSTNLFTSLKENVSQRQYAGIKYYESMVIWYICIVEYNIFVKPWLFFLDYYVYSSFLQVIWMTSIH